MLENTDCGVLVSVLWHDEDGDLDEAVMAARFEEIHFSSGLDAVDALDASISMTVPLCEDASTQTGGLGGGLLPLTEYDVAVEVTDRSGLMSNTQLIDGHITGDNTGCP